MSWLELLYQTYENNQSKIGKDKVPLLPICHTTQNAQIQVVVDGQGQFLRARVLASKEDAVTIIPATEESQGRSGTKAPPHPLCDKLKYVAGDLGDYIEDVGGNEEDHKNYVALLDGWCKSFVNPKLQAVASYIQKKRLIGDLVASQILELDDGGRFLRVLSKGAVSQFDIFELLQGSPKEQQESFVRFSVEIPEMASSDLWNDSDVWEGWSHYYTERLENRGLCYVTGQKRALAVSHPKKVRHAGDQAKLISSNDTKGFTFRGRLENSAQVCGVGYEVSQKAHSALRWLIGRQGNREGDQAYVAWAVSGAVVPDPWADLLPLLQLDPMQTDPVQAGDTAQDVGLQIASLIRGYSAALSPTDRVVVVGLDSATPGRMAIRYFRELTGSEFLERLISWHKRCSWSLEYGKGRSFFGAPSPRDIAVAAYGDDAARRDKSLRRMMVERLTPCIIDGAAVPRDLVASCVRRATSRHAMEDWEWKKTLGIACAVYRCSLPERNYDMALDSTRSSRDYLFGRLLAAADGLEAWALSRAQEKRQTNAARLMQRFAQHPSSTWKTIELALSPYKARLGGRALKFERVVEEVMNRFDTDDFVDDRSLDGEFLIGFHCQRSAFWAKADPDSNDSEPETDD